MRIALVLFLTLSLFSCSQEGEEIYYYIGSSDSKSEHSIYLGKLDPETGQTVLVDSFTGSQASSYLVLNPDHSVLYAVDRGKLDPEVNSHSVKAFQVNEADLSLQYMNSQASGGLGPCHVAMTEDGSYLFTANYGSGHFSAFPVDGDGRIRPASDVVKGEGSGPNPRRQTSPHAHFVSLIPGSDYLLVPDLGVDKVWIREFNPGTGKLGPNPNQPYLELEPGAGPRHLDFHPAKEFLYVLNELGRTLVACRYDPESGTIKILNTASTIEKGDTLPSTCAAVRVHPSGDFVYASNRGSNSSIALFNIKADGSIKFVRTFPDMPYIPRDFNITPDGKFMLVAGQRGHEIKVFRIDPETGMLSPTGGRLEVKAPANITFIDRRI